MDELSHVAQRHGLLLFEDAAQAHGAPYRGKRTGGLGRAGAFSFYPSKNLGALGDAGAICTNDGQLAAKARALGNLGRNSSGEHRVPGYNERLDGLQAALLRVKLPHLDAWNASRRALAARYREALGGLVELLSEGGDGSCVYHLFPIRVADRDGLASSLAAEDIATGVHYARCLPEHPALQDILRAKVPMARDWAARELSLPLFPGLQPEELERVAAAVRRLV
jgi:dTDP-4-amino-4,6-dideoxygalactose transaminase